MGTLRKTERFQLISGTLQARGCYRVIRLSDNEVSKWLTGGEGHAEAYRMQRLEENRFNALCAAMFPPLNAFDTVGQAHDALSEAVEDPDGGNDPILDGAIDLMAALNAFYEALKKPVVIEVYGGVAEVTSCPPGVNYTMIDHDNR